MPINADDINDGVNESLSDMLSRYSDGAEINSVIFNDLSGLDIDDDVEDFLQTYSVNNTSFWDKYYLADPNEYTASAVTDFTLGLTGTALEAQKGLSVTITNSVKALTTTTVTIEQALVEYVDGMPVKTYVEKATGKLVLSETILSETTHIPYGKVLAAAGKAVGVYAIYETFKDTLVSSYNSATGHESDPFVPFHNYSIAASSIVAGGAAATALASAPVAIVVLGTAIAGGLAAFTADSLVGTLPALVADAKALGKTLQQTLDEAYDEITQQMNDVWASAGQTADDILDEAQDLISDIYDGLKDLVPDLDLPLPDISGWLDTMNNHFNNGQIEASPNSPNSPLVLDLDGDGIELTAFDGPDAVLWDIDTDGFREVTGWATGGDGLLTLDQNSNGIIDDNSELFGNTSTYANGFENLDSLDSNSDNAITSADSQWNNLRVWIDSNGDGHSETAELHTLSSLGITSITTTYSNVNYQIAGNDIRQESSFVINGQTRDIVDAWLSYDNRNSEYGGSYTLDPRALFLPTFRGYGDVPDLHVAMSLDEDLLDMVEVLTTATVAEVQDAGFNFHGKFNAMLFRWTGVQNVSPGSPPNFDLQKLAAMEKMLGADFGEYLPDGLSVSHLNNAWNTMLSSLMGQFAAQLPALAQSGISFDPVSGDYDGMGAGFYVTSTSGQGVVAASGNHDLIIGSAGNNSLNGMDGNDVIHGGVGNDTLQGMDGNDTLHGEDGNDSLTGGNGNDLIYGGANTDTLNGNDGADQLYGGSGVDSLYGGAGDDVIDGGDDADNAIQGDDGNDTITGGGGMEAYLIGGAGDDTYVFRAGDSPYSFGTPETVLEYAAGGFDTIKLTGGILPADVRIWTQTNDEALYIKYSATDRIYVGAEIERIVFDNGTIWDYTAGYKLVDTDDAHLLYGTSYADDIQGNGGNDELTGLAGDDILSGGAGQDWIYGGDDDDTIFGGANNDHLQGDAGNDTIDGGAGYDYISGGAGDDTYVFRAGDSSISNPEDIGDHVGEGFDTIHIAGGISPNDTYTWVDAWGRLHVQYTATDEIIATGWDGWSFTTLQMERITFDNGTVWNYQNGYFLKDSNDAHDIYGSVNADTIYGGGGNDYIEAQDGNDVVEGGTGNDTMYGGNGTDRLTYESATSGITINLASFSAQNTGGAGIDTISGFENLTGSAFNDTLTGTTAGNVIEGGAGNDIMNGSGGTDTLSYASATAGITINLATATAQNTGGAGTDTISNFENITGSAFDDVLTGKTGNNVIDGGDGNDTIEGDSGTDTLIGGFGVDTVTYQNSTAAVTVNLLTQSAAGGEGNDTLSGFENIRGSAFNDTLTGDANDNTIEGASGNDTLNGSGGIDTLSYRSAAAGITINLSTATAQNTGGAGTDTISSFENLLGSDFDDTLTGTSSANVIEGGLGNDTMNGSGGTDTLSYANAAAGITINLSTAAAQNTGGAGTDTISSFENLIGSAFNDTLTGTTSGNVIEGGAGNDIMDGNSGTDTLSYASATAGITINLATATAQNTGGAGTDTISNFENITGSAFDDVLTGKTGNNVIDGGDGNDTIEGDSGTDTLIGGFGVDTVTYQNSTAAVTVNLLTGTSSGGEGSDTLSEFENLTGSAFNDTLTGSSTANTIRGGDGNDTINGGGGDDILYGSGGTDTITGSTGGDVFMFENASAFSAVDTVTDFNAGAGDKFDFHDILDAAFDPVTSAISDFVNFTNSGANSVMSIDRDGAGLTYGFTDVANVTGGAGLDETTLYNNGNLLVA